MSVFGTPIVQSAAGQQQAERAAAREADRKRPVPPKPSRTRDTDEVELQNFQTTDAVRGLTGNAREETNSDHRRHGNPEQAQSRPGKPRLDLKG